MLSPFTLAAFAALAAASLVSAQSATVIIEASHGGAGSGLTNTTITVPLNTPYVNSALGEVSTLYLTAADGATLSTITCTPYRYANLTGNAGNPFTSSTPSFLSTNTVSVGSLECSSYGGSTVTSSSASSTSSASASSSSASSASSNVSITSTSTTSSSTTASSSTSSDSGNGTLVSVPTSTLLSTTTASSPSQTQAPSTLTSIAVLSGSNGPSTSVVTTTSGGQVSSTTSATPSLNSQSAGQKLTLGNQLLSLCAIVAFGVAAIF